MAWERYHTSIVAEHSVRLVGWPASTFNPYKLGSGELKKCFDALYADPPTCYWESISDGQVEEMLRDMPSKTPRKARSDKGVARKRKRVKVIGIDDSTREQDDASDCEDDAPSP
jgi:hypothetical protein